MIEHGLHRARLDDLTGVHHGDLVGHRHLGQSVGHHEGGPPPDSLSCGTVKSRGTGAAGLRRRLTELEGLMADPATFGDSRRAAALGAELRFTGKAVKADDLLTGLEKELAEAQALAGEADPEMRRMADEEIRRLTAASPISQVGVTQGTACIAAYVALNTMRDTKTPPPSPSP